MSLHYGYSGAAATADVAAAIRQRVTIRLSPMATATTTGATVAQVVRMVILPT